MNNTLCQLAAARSSKVYINKDQYLRKRSLENPKARRTICAHSQGSLRLVPVNDVIYFQAENKYVAVQHEKGKVLILETLTALEKEFSEKFIRVHRNALVSKRHITGLAQSAAGYVYVNLDGADGQLRVSRNHVAKVKKLFEKRGRATKF